MSNYVFIQPRMRFSAEDLVVIIIAGVLAGLSYLLTAPVSLAPGVQYRLFAFVAPALGIILGKYRGGIAAMIAEATWAIISTYMLNIPVLCIATPFALVGNFFQAYIPARMVEHFGERGGIKVSLHNWAIIFVGSMLGLFVLSLLWFGVFFEVLGVAPYFVIVEMLWYSDALPIAIGTAPFVWIMLRIEPIRIQWKKRL
ncbi:MAG: hypothetical protein QCI38_01150 [Candidatus Thermoplasmatota archaeon]|nr:hypothetical protein [Candidatus Thermoplasmatota archaeon]